MIFALFKFNIRYNRSKRIPTVSIAAIQIFLQFAVDGQSYTVLYQINIIIVNTLLVIVCIKNGKRIIACVFAETEETLRLAVIS